MRTITYKGKDYPVRVLKVELEGEEQIIDIANGDFVEAMKKENGEEFWEGEEEGMHDSDIYYYIDTDLFDLSAEEICKDYLDTPMKFIKELEL